MHDRRAFEVLLIGLLLLISGACIRAQMPVPSATPRQIERASATPEAHPTATATPVALATSTATASPLAATSTIPPTSTSRAARPTQAPPTETALPEPATPIPPTVSPSPPTPTSEAGEPYTPAEGLLQAYETSLSIPTYGYEVAFQETAPDDPIYPYPRLDPAKVAPTQPRSYRAIVIENDYVSLMILPELGGRIYRWVDKSTGRRLLYENPVVKPTQWGYRGWWLAAGGMEWAFPVEEHGLNEWRPWRSAVGRNAEGIYVNVSDTEDRTGMEVGVTISLDAAHSYVTISPWAKNGTDTAQRYQYWINAMLTLGNNRVSGNTRLVLPTSQVIVHSTGDGTLPGAWQSMSWPVYNGRDLGRYDTWTNYLGFFAPQVSSGFVALYDESIDQGIVRSFAPGWPSGTKFFGPGTLPSGLWTDDDSGYVELWSGATATFADYATMQPGSSVAWSERWYPVQGIGSVRAANLYAAINIAEAGDTVNVGAAVTGPTSGTITLYADGTVAVTWDVTLLPGSAFRASWTRASGSESLGVVLRTSGGEVVLQTGAVP